MLKLKKIKPLFTTIITTADVYSEEDLYVNGSSLIDATKITRGIKEYQKVLAVGTSVRDIKVGDIVNLDYIRYSKMVHNAGSVQEATIKDNPIVNYIFNTVELNGKECLMLQDRDVNFVVEDYEEIKPKPIPKEPIIKVPKKKIIIN